MKLSRYAPILEELPSRAGVVRCTSHPFSSPLAPRQVVGMKAHVEVPVFHLCKLLRTVPLGWLWIYNWIPQSQPVLHAYRMKSVHQWALVAMATLASHIRLKVLTSDLWLRCCSYVARPWQYLVYLVNNPCAAPCQPFRFESLCGTWPHGLRVMRQYHVQSKQLFLCGAGHCRQQRNSASMTLWSGTLKRPFWRTGRAQFQTHLSNAKIQKHV